MSTAAFGLACPQERPQPLVPAKGSLSLEGVGFGANGSKGALGTARPAKTSREPTTTPHEGGWSTAVD